MLKSIFLAGLMSATVAYAQDAVPITPTEPSTFTLTLTRDEVLYVASALRLKPYGEVANLLAKIQGQLDEQLKPKAEAKSEAEALKDGAVPAVDGEGGGAGK